MSDVRAHAAVESLPEPRQLRPYQIEAASNVEAAWNGIGRERNPRVAVVLATGCGKSSVISSLATRARAAGKRVLLLAHRTELLEQMAETVGVVEPGGERVGIVAAERNENDTAIVAASFQTLARSEKRVADLGPRDVILADECFPAGTLLAGGCPIDKVTVGRTVASWDETRRCIVQRKVTHVFKSKPSSLVRVTFDDKSSVVCTEGHPFLVHGSRPFERVWREATLLTRNTRVVQGGTYGERTLRVYDVEDIKPGDDGEFSECSDGYVYNIEVEGTHTYLLANNAVVHNCHHISAPTYLKVLEDLGAMDDSSGVVSCGFTATMYRDDGKALGDVWSEVVFERDLLWAIENGYLIPPRGKTVALASLNQLAKIRTVGGDYKQGELAEVMSASVESTVDAILRHCPQSAMIVFAAGVDHAQALAESLTASGIPAKEVTGAHNREYREKAYKEFRNGALSALVTVQVLTEGADFPRCDTVVMARPTRSKVLLCFDQETEILTSRGWINGAALQDGDTVAQWDSDTNTVSFVEPQHRFTRPVSPEERMVSLNTPSTSIRVTEDHRVYYRPKHVTDDTEWRVSPACDLAEKPARTVWLPTAGTNSFHGIPLTDDEVRLIAWITTDGGVGKTRGAYVAQSKPKYVKEIERVIRACGIKYGTYTDNRPTNFGERANPLVRYTMSFGVPRGRDKHLRGWAHLSPWMFKSDFDAYTHDGASVVRGRWENASEHQWDVFMEVMDAANGANTDSSSFGWTPRSMHVAISNLHFAEWVQSMCAQRGWSTSLVQHKGRTDIWMLHAKKISKRAVGGSDGRATWTFEAPYPSEQVWCVTVPSGAVVTRRKGKVTILGQCQMIGRAVRPYTDPVTGVAKTDATVLDLTGVVRDVKLVSLTDLLPDAKREVYNSDGDDITEEVAAADELLGKKPGKERQGRIDLEDIDLMGRPRRKVLWLTTSPINANGDEYMFLPPRTSKSYLFLYPALNRMSNDSLVMLAHRDQFGNVTMLCDANGNPVRGTMVQAMDAAEHMLPSSDLTKTAAEWRKPTVKPTEGQLALGRNLGIEGIEYMSRAELYDRISSNFGTRLIRDAVAKLPANL